MIKSTTSTPRASSSALLAPAGAPDTQRKLTAPGDTRVKLDQVGAKPGVKTVVQQASRDISGTTWAYSIHQVEGSTNPDVVYFLTTIDGDQSMWKKQFERKFQLAWAGRNAKLPKGWAKDPPAVVCIAMDPDVFGLKLFDTVGKDGEPGKLRAFVDTIMPEVEGRLAHKPAARHFLGMSMGGFNALQVLWHHPELITSLALVAPMLPANLYDESATANFAKRTGASDFESNAMFAMLRDEYETRAEWDAANPMNRVASAMSSASPPLYIHMNVDDSFGFFENSVVFANTARERGADVTKNVAKGGHGDNIDMKAIVQHIALHSTAKAD